MLKGGAKSFGVVFMPKLEVLAILKGGRKMFPLLKGGREKFYPVLRGGVARHKVLDPRFSIL